MAQLLHSLCKQLVLHECAAEDAARFLATHDEQQIRAAASAGPCFYVAEIAGELAGFIAIREPRHVFYMFVSLAHHRNGIASALWKAARAALGDGSYTVNSSSHAVPFYERIGFVSTAPRQCQQGIYFTPMRLA